MKKFYPLALALSLFLAVLSPLPVRAQGGIRVLSESAEAAFPVTLTFNLSVESGANLVDIRLNYLIRRESFARVVSEAYIDFPPARKVNARWTLEMVRIGGVPSGTIVDYFWTVMDASRNRLTTKPSQVQFDDRRYPWKQMTRGQINLYWYEGDDAFAGEIMNAAEEALSRLTRDTGATLSKPVKLHIYASAGDLKGSMINPQEWTGGVAFSRYGAIAIGIAKNELDWGKRAVVHEFTHLIINQVTLSPYSELPVWLNEGIAMYNEGALEPQFASILSQAVQNRSLISVRSLASPFSALPSKSYLSYAESYSIVELLTSKYGRDKMFDLLSTFREGATYDGALMKIYGFDMDGLNTFWQESLVKSQKTAGVGKAPVASDGDLAFSRLFPLLTVSGIRKLVPVRTGR